MIYAHLKDLKAFEKFHPLLLQQICYYSFYEDLEQGVIRTFCLLLLLLVWWLWAGQHTRPHVDATRSSRFCADSLS